MLMKGKVLRGHVETELHPHLTWRKYENTLLFLSVNHGSTFACSSGWCETKPGSAGNGSACFDGASKLSITDVRSNLLPEDKIRIIEDMQKRGMHVAMVGDGVNDAPALAEATVGIAMGAIGTEAAMEAAEVVLMNDDLTKITQARAISKKAYRTIQENIIVGVGVVHVTGIILVLLKIIGPVEAAAIHLVPDFLVFVNSIKLLKVKIS